MATFHHARVFTGAGERDVASAFRIRDGRFTWVGEAADLPAAERAAAVDLGGRTVLPGFLDVHTHPAMMATLADAVPCLPPAVTSIDQLVAALRAGPDAAGWLTGDGYDDAKFPGGIGPTAADLDRVSHTRPILVHRCDGHSAVANTAGLAAGGVTAATPNPPGAAFGRYADGRPNGVLTEVAAVDRVAAARPVPDAGHWTDRLAGLGRHFLSHGIVGVDDLRAAAVWCRRNRVQLAVHAMGDRALRRVVELFADREPWLADRPSIRLEHATLVSADLLRRLTSARMRFAVVTHTIFLFAEFDSYARNLSPRQFEIAYPIRSVYESGLAAALASDRPGHRLGGRRRRLHLGPGGGDASR